MKIVITGAAGQISYSLIPFLCERGIFSNDERLDLALVEIPPAMNKLEGFVKDPTSLSLGRFYNDSLRSGDLVQINQ